MDVPSKFKLAVIQVSLSDPYSKIIKFFSRQKMNLIGICYDGQCYLFNTHNASPSKLVPHCSFNFLTKCSDVKSVKITEIEETAASTVILPLLTSCLQIGETHKEYSEADVIKSYFYDDIKNVETGYTLVNRFLFKLVGFTPSKVSGDYIEETSKLGKEIEAQLEKTYRIEEEIILNQLNSLSKAFIEVIMDDYSVIGKLDLPECKKRKINLHLLKNVGDYLSKILQNLDASPTVDLYGIINAYNKFARDYDQDIKLIDKIAETPRSRKVSIIKTATVSSNESPVKSYSLAQNSVTDDLLCLTHAELKSLLVYIDSLRSDEGKGTEKYTRLKNIIVRILASKK